MSITQATPFPMRPARRVAAPGGKSLLLASGWYRVARTLLWGVIATASIKPSEVLGAGEQVMSDYNATNGPIDLLFRCAILAICLSTAFLAMVTGRIRRFTLLFIPFAVWTILVALGQQADFFSVKQLASYATWILFFISATALLDEPGDFEMLRNILALSVVTSAIGGTIQALLGYAPMVGFTWENLGYTRVHTGGGGILLDAFTPYCAAMLFLVASASRPRLQLVGVLFAVWASANILRGGLLGFSIAMLWILIVTPRSFRMRLLKGAGVAFLLVCIGFGGKIVQKSITADDETNTSDERFNTSGRFEHWPQLIEWIEQEPIWGHGPNADMLLLQNSDGSDLRAAHNELLSTAVNFGIVGTLLLWLPLLGLLLASLYLTYRHRRELPQPLLAAGGVLLMVAVLSLTDNTLRVPGVMILALAPVTVALNRTQPLNENWC